MVGKKTTFLLLVIICFFLAGQNIRSINAVESALSKEVEFARNISCYNCNIDWHALVKPENNQILYTCLAGASLSELEQLCIENLHGRLKELQSGNLILKVGDTYKLAFPAVLGDKRAVLQKMVEQTASEALPFAEKMIKDILPLLPRREKMLYHVTWSIVMDGPIAWYTLETELKKQVQKYFTSLNNVTWLIYPNHPYRAGTNTYDDFQNDVAKITWSPYAPQPDAVHNAVKAYENKLAESQTKGQSVEPKEAMTALAKFGLVDSNGISHIYIIDSNSQEAQVYGDLNRKFALEVMAHLDVKKVSDFLGVPPNQGLVIIYHEICYELIKQLSAKKVLEIPEIALKPGVETTQMRYLISLVRLKNKSNLSNPPPRK